MGGATQERVTQAFAPAVDQVEQARQLVAVIQQLSLARRLPEIQEIVRVAARRLTGADGATFVLRDGPHCFYADEDAISPLWKGRRFPLESCISGWTMLNRQPAVIEDIYSDERIPHEAYRPTFVKSLAMVPIRTIDPIGAIGNYWADPHRASPAEVELLQALADSTAIALENARHFQQLEQARLEMLQRLALAAEYRDDATHEHTERVATTTARIADRLGLPNDEIERLRQAAPLHDIGKLGISDTILLKPGKLTPAEFAEMQRHTTAGAAILAGSSNDILQLAHQIALSHHEWWNGTGYPNQLAGTDIPLSGRIVAIADVFDALTHERPYKHAWSVNDALAELDRLTGSQFDPDIITAFHATL